jgi:phage baseplate assembly protein W
MAISNIIYSDISVNAGTSNDAELVFNEHSINQNILMITQTPKGSKWWRPNIGSNLHRYLYDPVDDITADNIQRELENVLKSNLEFRVNFTVIEVIADRSNQNFYVNIEYKVSQLEGKTVSFEFTLGKRKQGE